MNLTVAWQGWLQRDNTLPWCIGGIHVSPDTRTRREEYWWVSDSLCGDVTTVLDAATGYVPSWHMLPYILAAPPHYAVVDTIDADPRTMNMPYNAAVQRRIGDITALPWPDDHFDAVCCISVLEHLEPAQQQAAAAELERVCRRQLLITADYGAWLPQLWGLSSQDAAAMAPEAYAEMLNPPVYAMDIRKGPS